MSDYAERLPPTRAGTGHDPAAAMLHANGAFSNGAPVHALGAAAAALAGAPAVQRLRGAAAAIARPAASPTISGTRPVQRLVAGVDALLNAHSAADPRLVTVPAYLNAISEILTMVNVPHRFGGSLAARLQGARRVPRDIDLEVENGPDVATAYHNLLQANGVTYTYRGVTVLFHTAAQGLHPNLHGGLNLTMTDQGGNTETVFVDISNENAPQFVGGVQSPQQRGVNPGMGSLVTAPELIMNYVRRALTNPQRSAQAVDHQQIAQLLHSAGFNPMDPVHVQQLHTLVLNTFDPPNQQAALNYLGAVINYAMANPQTLQAES